MSKGRQRKREDQFRYQMSEQIQQAVDSRLLAPIPPERERVVDARSAGSCVPPGSLLWARLAPNGTVEFVHGETICGRATAEVIAQLGAPLESTLFQVVADEGGLLSMRAAPADPRIVRPPTEDDDAH